MTTSYMDLAVVVLYLGAMVAFGLYFYFRVHGFSEYYDAGRRWGPWAIGAAVAAANIGAANTVGSVGLAYREGYSAVWYVTLQALAFIPFSYLAVRKFYELREMTVAEYLENRYRTWLRPVAGTALALATFAILPAQIVGGASVIRSLTGLEDTTAFVTVGAVLVLYTALGGLPSVIYSNILQWVLMVGGFVVGIPLLLHHNGGLAAIASSLPADHGSIWSGASGGWGFFTILAWSITVVFARFGSQEWYQTARAAGSATIGRRGFVIGGLMAAPFGLLTMLVGIAALKQLPGLDNSEEAFARAMMSVVPVGLRALVMASILAAVLSTGEASVNAATALLVNDLGRKLLFVGRSDRFYLRLSQVACVLFGSAALALALSAPAIVAYIRLGFLIRTPVAVAVLAGLYWRGATALGAAAGIVFGTSTVLAWQILGNPERLDPFWVGAPMTALALVAGSSLSRASRSEAAVAE